MILRFPQSDTTGNVVEWEAKRGVPPRVVGRAVGEVRTSSDIVGVFCDEQCEDLSFLRSLDGPLHALEARGGCYPQDQLDPLRNIEGLQILGLGGAVLDDSLFGLIAECTSLNQLALVEGSYSRQGLQKLQSLNLAYLELHQSDGSLPTNEDLAWIVNTWPGLASLAIYGGSLDDGAWQSLGPLSDLELLWLTENDLTGSGIGALEQLPSLRRLILRNSAFADEAVPELARLSGLQRINLRGTNLTPSSVGQLVKLGIADILVEGSGVDPAELAALRSADGA
jgi:hypothetical protein